MSRRDRNQRAALASGVEGGRGGGPSGQISATFSATQITVTSPIPPPEVMARYEQLLPGSMDRILAMAEKQLDHRQVLEKRAVDANASAQKVGVWFGGILAFTLIVSGGAVAIWGHNLWGLAAALTAGAGVIGNANYMRHRQERERDKKLQGAQQPPKF